MTDDKWQSGQAVAAAPSSCGTQTLYMENDKLDPTRSPFRRLAGSPFRKDGIAIEYDDTGTGENVLVLVHGHPFNRSMWRPQIEAIAGSNWRVIAPDLRGYGVQRTTTNDPGKTTLDVFARDIAGLLDELGIGQVVIGGLSMGGQIVMEFCRLYQKRVRAILLAATFPQAETEEGRRNRLAMADRLLREGMDQYAEEVLPKMLAPASIAALPEVAAKVRAMMRSTDPSGAAAALRGRAERPDYESTLAKLHVPALIVVGDQDAFTTRADAERMQELIKESELVMMKGVGHMPNLERVSAFNEAVGRWLRRTMTE